MRRPPVVTLGVALLLLLPAVASAADRYVSTSGDDTSNSCLTAASPCATIARAVGQAASGDTINIDAGTYSGAGNAGVHIDSAKNLSFAGAGRTQTIIDGGNAARLFLFEPTGAGPFTIAANFSDLTLQNGNSDGGGAIKASQDVAFTLSLSRVSVSGNTVPAGNDGGAIQARNGNVAICDSTFTNNTATVGGAITAKRVTIENCPSSPPGTPAATFTGNAVATAGQGGAIHATKVTADNVTFDGNAAPGGDGGAIVISTMSTEATALTLSNATFIHNDASSGGAFRVSNAGDVMVSDTTFDDNDASGYGGAFRTDGGDVTVERSTITGSNAGTAAAGAVAGLGTLTVDHSTINGNRAAMFAGFVASNGEIGMVNSTLHGNTASTYGLLYSDAAIRLRNVTSSGNPVTSNHFFTADLEVVNSIIDESGSSVCTWSSTINGGGNVLSSTVGSECDGMASPTPTSRVPAASIRLGSLADNGGPTKTMSIGHESTALGIGGSPNACPITDQRGEARPDTGCDAGAFERPSFMLTVSASGPGAGTVTGAPTDSTPGAIDCGATCAQEFDQDTPVALTATAAPGSVFTGWAGACSGTSPTCTVAMGEARSATATFGIAPAAPTPVASAPVTPGPGPTSQTRSTRRPSNKVVVRSTTSTGGALITRLVVESAGTIVQQGTFVPRRAAATAARPACRATVVAPVAGGYAVTCRLNRAARSQLGRGALRLRVRTTFTPLGGVPRSTVRTICITR